MEEIITNVRINTSQINIIVLQIKSNSKRRAKMADKCVKKIKNGGNLSYDHLWSHMIADDQFISRKWRDLNFGGISPIQGRISVSWLSKREENGRKRRCKISLNKNSGKEKKEEAKFENKGLTYWRRLFSNTAQNLLVRICLFVSFGLFRTSFSRHK